MCLLLGYGAGAINPYLAFETIEDLIAEGASEIHDPVKAVRNYIKACGKGILKVMSKMGISTVASYTGAQIFEAIGLSQDLVDEFFTGTVSRLGGVGLDVLAEEVRLRHKRAYPDRPAERAHRALEVGGEYQWRREGEYHLFNPETVYRLQHATRSGRYDIFKQYTRLVDDQSRQLATLRGLFKFKVGERPPVPIEEVEPVSEIVRAVRPCVRSVPNAPGFRWRQRVKEPFVQSAFDVQSFAGFSKTPPLVAQKPQKMFVCGAARLSKAVSVCVPVDRLKPIGSEPRKLDAGGGQSWLVGYASPVVFVSGVQARPSFGPPWQVPTQTGQG